MLGWRRHCYVRRYTMGEVASVLFQTSITGDLAFNNHFKEVKNIFFQLWMNGHPRYEKKVTKNIRPTDILLVFSKCSQIY